MKNTKFSQDIYRLERILRDEFSWKQALICFESLKPAVIKSDERVDKLDNTNVCIHCFYKTRVNYLRCWCSWWQHLNFEDASQNKI